MIAALTPEAVAQLQKGGDGVMTEWDGEVEDWDEQLRKSAESGMPVRLSYPHSRRGGVALPPACSQLSYRIYRGWVGWLRAAGG
jgi:hypothetical protein